MFFAQYVFWTLNMRTNAVLSSAGSRKERQRREEK